MIMKNYKENKLKSRKDFHPSPFAASSSSSCLLAGLPRVPRAFFVSRSLAFFPSFSFYFSLAFAKQQNSPELTIPSRRSAFAIPIYIFAFFSRAAPTHNLPSQPLRSAALFCLSRLPAINFFFAFFPLLSSLPSLLRFFSFVILFPF
jgi:hypothetical protein